MSFIEPTGEHVVLGQVPPLDVREAELVRDVAMKDVWQLAKRKNVSRTEDKIAHRFIFYDNSGGQIGSGLTDTMMSVSVAKKERRFQSMRISFLELILKQDHRYSNYREVYAFDWFEDKVFAHKTNIEILGDFVTRHDKSGKTIDSVSYDRAVSVLPVQPEDCDVLCSRMLSLAHYVVQSSARAA